MKRTQLYLSDKQYEFYKSEAEWNGVSMAECIRQALEKYMREETDKALTTITKRKKGKEKREKNNVV